MKICIVSYDYWDYDAHIGAALRKKNVEVLQLNISKFTHKNWGNRLQNAFSKTFFKKNLKSLKRKEFIFEELKKSGKQDQILVINPELFDLETHEFLKSQTRRYIAYLYDSMARNPVEHLLHFFHDVYSFDRDDCKTYGFTEITNYNYLSVNQDLQRPSVDLVYLASFDERLGFLEKIQDQLDKISARYLFIIAGKQGWKKKFTNDSKSVIYQRKFIPHKEIPKIYAQGKGIVDLVREGQTGLSFRFFEAMGLGKKVVTNNIAVKEYDFYNPKNILVIEDDVSVLQKSFFETDYEELPKEIYQKYTVENWVETVFNLECLS